MMSSLKEPCLPCRDRLRRCILLLAGAEDNAIRSGATLQKLLYTVAKCFES